MHAEEEVTHEPVVEPVGHQYPDEVLEQDTHVLDDTHAVEDVDPAGDVVPEGHCVQEVAAASEYVLAGQRVGVNDPVVQKLPAGHEVENAAIKAPPGVAALVKSL